MIESKVLPEVLAAKSSSRLFRIFVIHPSALLTDHLGNGDGLAVDAFLRGLAATGHELHVAYDSIDVREAYPPNISLYPIGSRRWPRPLDRLPYMWRSRVIYERLRNERPFDFVHQFNPVFAGLSLAMLGCGTPIVLGPYVPAWPRVRSSSLRAFMQSLLEAARDAIVSLQQRYASAIIISSDAAVSRIGRGVSSARIYRVPFGIPASFMQTKSGECRGDGRFKILFVGSLEKRKGIEVLLQAFREVYLNNPQAQLRVVGVGKMLDDVRRMAEEMPAGAISVEGHVSRTDLPSVMDSADVFCAPSFGEPFGIAVLEAMACGKPVVATNCGAFPYLVPEGGGLLVPPRDPLTLAAALQRLISDPELRRTMGECNRAVVHERYTWARAVHALQEVYKTLIIADVASN